MHNISRETISEIAASRPPTQPFHPKIPPEFPPNNFFPPPIPSNSNKTKETAS